jgi:hypothetical protein
MDLRADIELIISKDVEEVVNTPLILKLLRIYSILYLGGLQPRACGKCQRGYYEEVKLTGLQKFEAMETNLNRTCELVSKDLIYLSPMQIHLSNVNLTDEIAVKCLDKGWLKPSDFKNLPDGYKVKTHSDIIGTVEIPTVPPVRNQPKRRK